MASPLVSIAMAMRNAERTVALAIESVLCQTCADWELLIVDDGSRDASIRIAEQFNDPRIRIFSDGRHLGLGARLNELVSRASGRYLARMDADDVAYPERLAEEVAFLEANPSIDLVGAGTVVFEGSGIPVGTFLPPAIHGEICARPWASFPLPHPTWMGRIEWFRGRPYDERSRTEDQALLLSAYRSSRFAALSRPLLGYRQDAIPVSKVWRGRLDYCRALSRTSPALAARGVLSHVAKLLLEVVAIGLGQERRLLAHRARPLPARERARWGAIWQAVNEGVQRRGITLAGNIDAATVNGFGAEWQRFDAGAGSEAELADLFGRYFAIFPWDALPPGAQGFDAGCGTGRWAKLIAPRVGKLYCFDASPEALSVARKKLSARGNCELHVADVSALPIPDASMDFGYSLGVLHHVPDPKAALAACARKLHPGAPFLIYLYYALDDRPAWFRALWRMSDWGRRTISFLPFAVRSRITDTIAALVYWPLARAARAAEAAGACVDGWPLAQYRLQSFYVMRNDSLDRFGTALERRFTRGQIKAMLEAAGFERVRFSEQWPYWCAVGFRTQG